MDLDRRHRHRRTGASILVAAIAVVGFLACGPAPVTVPLGAPEVHVSVDESGIHLTPSMIQPGTVYIVDDSDRDESGHALFTFVRRDTGSLSAEDLTALSLGQHPQGLDVEDGWGTVTELTLEPGTYAFTTATDIAEGAGVPPDTAVLVVAP